MCRAYRWRSGNAGRARTRDGILEVRVMKLSGPGDGGSVTDASRSRRGLYTTPVVSLVALLEGLEEFGGFGYKGIEWSLKWFNDRLRRVKK